MLSRAHRFHGFKSLSHVYRTGQTVRGPLFAVKVSHNSRRQTYRAAVIVSRKVHKSAVARNRMRRRLYETLHSIDNNIVEPYDIVITVFSEAVLDAPAKSLEQQIRSQLKNAGVLVKRIR
jgi:ribonuclease P protein component